MVRLSLLWLALVSGVAFAQSSDEVAREIQRLKTLTDEERRGMAASSARQATWRSQSKSRLAGMRDDTRRLSREKDSLRKLVDLASRPRPAPVAPKTSAALRREALAKILADDIEKSIPLLAGTDSQAVADRWSQWARGLRQGKGSGEEVLARYLDDLAERLDLMGSVRARPGTWTNPAGRTHKGVWLDVGPVPQAFVATQGGLARWRHDDGHWSEWTDPALVEMVARNVRILQGDAPPAWLILPGSTEPRP